MPATHVTLQCVAVLLTLVCLVDSRVDGTCLIVLISIATIHDPAQSPATPYTQRTTNASTGTCVSINAQVHVYMYLCMFMFMYSMW